MIGHLDVICGIISIQYKANNFYAPVEVFGCECGKKLKKNAYVRFGSVRDVKLFCGECAGVPKLAAHKYSGSEHSPLFPHTSDLEPQMAMAERFPNKGKITPEDYDEP